MLYWEIKWFRKSHLF